MATGPVEADPAAALGADYHALTRRLADSEATVQRLTEELNAAHARIEQLERRPTTIDSQPLSLFEGGEYGGDSLTGDGSDPRVLSLVLGATAIVAGMVTLLALFNHSFIFGTVALAVTIGLGYAANKTRVVPVDVSVVRGMVYVQQGETTHRFDVRNPNTEFEQVGHPGDPDWELRFARKGMSPFVIDASMVNAPDFVAKLREWRPEL